MKISMCMIVKDAAEDLSATLASFWEDVDEVVLVDTGSSDDTMEIAALFANTTDYPEKLVTGAFDWTDDFSAARNYADSLAAGDYLTWCDADDTVHGLANLRALAEEHPDVNAFYCLYEYAVQDEKVICELVRERLVKRGTGTWIDRVHESQYVQGMMMKVDPAQARWTHRKPPFEQSDRNTKILEKWIEDEPENPRVLSNLARDYMSNQRYKDAIPIYERYLVIPGQQQEVRAQATRQLCTALCAIGRFEWAKNLAVKCLGEHPTWPDTYNTLAELAVAQNDWNRAIFNAQQVLNLGQPETLLIINPQDYDERPKALIATSLAALGKINEACELAEDVLSKSPGFLDVPRQLAEWQSTRQRDQTAGMWAQCASLLVSYDEPIKAETLLQTVPHYAVDHPHVIAARVQVSEAMAEPYQVEKITDGARAEFLLRGLREQADAWELAA